MGWTHFVSCSLSVYQINKCYQETLCLLKRLRKCCSSVKLCKMKNEANRFLITSVKRTFVQIFIFKQVFQLLFSIPSLWVPSKGACGQSLQYKMVSQQTFTKKDSLKQVWSSSDQRSLHIWSFSLSKSMELWFKAPYYRCFRCISHCLTTAPYIARIDWLQPQAAAMETDMNYEVGCWSWTACVCAPLHEMQPEQKVSVELLLYFCKVIKVELEPFEGLNN